jgi:hypothetical protein
MTCVLGVIEAAGSAAADQQTETQLQRNVQQYLVSGSPSR